MTATALAGVDVLRDRIRDAAARRTPLRIVGTGTWLDAGRPVAATEALSVRPLDGIVEYVPGDLTLTVRGGTSLAEIRSATAAHGQWLALDPHGPDDATIGATVATASAGPLATGFGSPRDLVLGVEFVTGAGAIVRGGGRVVKNVAGFDLTRLVTGSWGTLGVITEVTVRLHARPESDESFAIPCDDGVDGIERVRQVLGRAASKPYSCEIVNAALARKLDVGDGTTVLVRFGGNAESVGAQRDACRELGAPTPLPNDVWSHLRTAEPPDAVVFRLSQLPSRLAATWHEAMAFADQTPGTFVHAAAIRGVVRCIIPAAGDSAKSLGRLFDVPSIVSRIGERLPASLWPPIAKAGANERLTRRIKSTFDPAGILNPGILGAAL